MSCIFLGFRKIKFNILIFLYEKLLCSFVLMNSNLLNLAVHGKYDIVTI